MTTIGYARVSTDGQSLQSQTEALHQAGASKVYSEKQSGAYTDRPQLAKAIAAVAEGSLSDSWANTDTAHGRLMLTVLGGLAEFERHLIFTRTSEGRIRAQANGVRFGRKPSLTAYQRAKDLRRRAAGETLTEIAKRELQRKPYDDSENADGLARSFWCPLVAVALELRLCHSNGVAMFSPLVPIFQSGPFLSLAHYLGQFAKD